MRRGWKFKFNLKELNQHRTEQVWRRCVWGKQKHRTTPSLKRWWLSRRVKKCWTRKRSWCLELFSVGGRGGSERAHSHHTCRMDDLTGPPSDITITVLTNTLICRPNTQFFISPSSARQTFSRFASFICFSCLPLFSYPLPSSYPYFASTFPLLTQHANNPLPCLYLACIIGWLKHQNLYKHPQFPNKSVDTCLRWLLT